MELTFSTACSRSDPFLSHQDATYPHLDSLPFHSLVIWTDGFVLFPLTKEAVTSLLTGCFVVLRSSLHIRQAQFVQVFLLKTAPFYKLYNVLISTNNAASFLLFPDSRFVLYTFSLFGLFFMLFGTSGMNYPFSRLIFLSCYNWSLVTYIFRIMTQPMRWLDICSVTVICSRMKL